MNIQEIKKIIRFDYYAGEELGIENASTLRKQEPFIRNFEEISRKRRGNYRWRSVTAITGWIWIFKSD